MSDALQPARLGPGISRFTDPRSVESGEPFPAYVMPPVPSGLGTCAIEPEFSSHGSRTVVTVRIDLGTSLYGTGEVSGPLRRNGRVIECWNTDAFSYTDESR